MSTSKELAGVIAYFDDPSSLIAAMNKVREARYESFDAFTPYPVHGLEVAQGLGRSPLPWVTFLAGLTGCAIGFSYQYFTAAVDWPLNVAGKPLNSWPAFVPVMFELTVLIAGLSTVAAMFAINGLPNIFRRSFDPSLTRDRFAILIEAPRKKSSHDSDHDSDETAAKKKAGFKSFAAQEAQDFLKSAGAREVKTVYHEGWF